MKFRRLISLGLDWARHKEPPFSLGSASLVATALANNISVDHRTWRINESTFCASDVTQYVLQRNHHNSVAAFGGYTWNDEHILQITRDLKKEGFLGSILLGGPQVSYTKFGLEKFYPDVDYFIRGYAEHALSKFLQGEGVVKGLHKAGDPDLGLSAHVDLEALPSPFLDGLIPPQHFIRWETQRGCPFSCRFCQYQEVNKKDLKRRYLNTSRIEQEIKWICQHNIMDIHVVDATFNSGPNYLNVLKLLAEHGYKGKIALQTRAEMISPEYLDAVDRLNRSAMVVLELGLHTTNKEEQKIIDRPNNLKKFSRVVSDAISRGIELEVSLIFGLPKQTIASFNESIAYCKTLGIPVIYAFPLMLHRGTWLWENRDELGLKSESHIPLFDISRQQHGVTHVVESPTFTYAEWLHMAKIAEELEHDSREYVKNRDVKFQLPTYFGGSSSFFRELHSKEPGRIKAVTNHRLIIG